MKELQDLEIQKQQNTVKPDSKKWETGLQKPEPLNKWLEQGDDIEGGDI